MLIYIALLLLLPIGGWVYSEWDFIQIKHKKFQAQTQDNWFRWWDDTYQIRQGTVDWPYDPSPKPRHKRNSNASV